MGKLQQQLEELHLRVEGSAQLKSTSSTFFATNPKASKRFKRVCVFCGSSSGNGTVFSNVALDLGRELVERNINLVYGGGNIGLMGQVAQMVHNSGGDVVGVIPKALIGPDLAGHTVGASIIVNDMHQRKAEMARRSEAFIALPGGFGTLEELLEVITWSQLRIHDKPIGLLNVDGYYDSLLTLFDNMQAQGFLKFNARTLVVSAPTPAELLDKLEAYTAVLDRSMPKLCWDVQENQMDLPYITCPIPSRVQ